MKVVYYWFLCHLFSLFFLLPRWHLCRSRWPCLNLTPCIIAYLGQLCIPSRSPTDIVACASVATLSCYFMYLCIAVCFFTLHITARFFFVFLVLILSLMVFCFFISSVFPDVFKAPPLRCVAEKLPETVLGSRTDSTTLTYFNGFKRWRANAFYRHLAKVEFVAME